MPNRDTVWENLGVVFRWLVEQVTQVNAVAWSSSGRTSTDVFPFGAYLSFSRSGEPGVEDLVISLDCKRVGEELVLSSDIAAGDGYVLADGPTVRIRLGDAIGDAPPEVSAWVDSVADFIRSHQRLVCARLSLDAGPP